MKADSVYLTPALFLAIGPNLAYMGAGCGGETAASVGGDQGGAGGDQGGAGGDQGGAGGDQGGAGGDACAPFACSLRPACSLAPLATCVVVQCFDPAGNPPPAAWSPDASCDAPDNVAAAAACGVQRCCNALAGVSE